MALEGCGLLGDLALKFVAPTLELDKRPRPETVELGAQLLDLVGELARATAGAEPSDARRLLVALAHHFIV